MEDDSYLHSFCQLPRSHDEIFPVNDATVHEVEFHFRFFFIDFLHFIWKSGNTTVLDVHARTDAVHCRAGGASLNLSLGLVMKAIYVLMMRCSEPSDAKSL